MVEVLSIEDGNTLYEYYNTLSVRVDELEQTITQLTNEIRGNMGKAPINPFTRPTKQPEETRTEEEPMRAKKFIRNK